MTLRRLPLAGTWTLFAVALIALLAHVCALPFHAHAKSGAPPVHEPHHDDSPGDAIHGASCDGTAARAPGRAAPTLAVVLPALAVDVPARDVATDVSVATPARSRPLFLLHAALLI
ncbi:MAG: hypothetical protein ACREM3_20475 [Candidatus Rokuibacteriota bacterium]